MQHYKIQLGKEGVRKRFFVIPIPTDSLTEFFKFIFFHTVEFEQKSFRSFILPVVSYAHIYAQDIHNHK